MTYTNKTQREYLHEQIDAACDAALARDMNATAEAWANIQSLMHILAGFGRYDTTPSLEACEMAYAQIGRAR